MDVTEPEMEEAIRHEFVILVLMPFLMSAAWFVMNLISIDPPFLGWILVVMAEFGIEYLDKNRFGEGLRTGALWIRGAVNFFTSLLGVGLAGFLNVITGPPTPRGPFTFMISFAVFMSMIAIIRTVLAFMEIAARIDFHASANYVRDWIYNRHHQQPQPAQVPPAQVQQQPQQQQGVNTGPDQDGDQP